jgi:hypothetical protein
VDPSENKFELEYKAANYSRQNEEFLDRLWSSGAMLDVDNDTYRTAQFLSSRTGDFTLNGELRNSRDSTGGDSTFENDVDWYALALMAGQTIKIEEPGYDSKGNWRSAFSNWDTAVHIYEPGYFYDLDVDNTSTDDHWLDSFGYKTEEDWGHSSRYDGLDRLGAMTFTAPTAGVYYLKVFNPRYEGGGQYRLKFTNATKAALGGVNITADYSSVMNVPYAVRFDEIGDIVYELFTDNLVRYNHGTFKAEDSNIATKNAGNIGGIIIYGESYWANINTFEGGDIVSFEANEVGSRYLKNDIGTYLIR